MHDRKSGQEEFWHQCIARDLNHDNITAFSFDPVCYSPTKWAQGGYDAVIEDIGHHGKHPCTMQNQVLESGGQKTN